MVLRRLHARNACAPHSWHVASWCGACACGRCLHSLFHQRLLHDAHVLREGERQHWSWQVTSHSQTMVSSTTCQLAFSQNRLAVWSRTPPSKSLSHLVPGSLVVNSTTAGLPHCHVIAPYLVFGHCIPIPSPSAQFSGELSVPLFH